MKKNLLSLALLFGLGLSVPAQAQWTLLNTTGPQTPPDYFFSQVQAVSDQVVWSLIQENVTSSKVNLLTRTINGGTSFTLSAINGTANYSAANIHAIDGNTAYVAQFGAANGGEVVKTVNGGTSWAKSTTATQFVASQGGFADMVYFFDANNGVALGDPTNGYFEIYTTSNAGGTWTRVPSANIPAPLDANEYGLVGSYDAIGNTIWVGTIHLLDPADQTTGIPARILKSTDRGLTWTASAVTPILGAVSGIAFTDVNNGIAYSGTSLIATTDGGANWTTQTYTGNFNHFDVAAVPGTNILVSVGASVETVTAASDRGTSYSTNNGRSWVDIERGVYHPSVDFVSRTVGFAGGLTDPTGAGGIYKSTTTILASRNAEVQKALSVYPNPSTSGIFNLQLASGIKAGTTVRVFDAVGRLVLNNTLNGTAVSSKETTLDLSKEKAGLYTLELRTDAGVAQQKLVIE